MSKQRQFKRFKVLVRKWLERLAPDYDVTIHSGELTEAVQAECHGDGTTENKVSAIVLSTGCDILPPEALNRLAYHEVLHLVFRKVSLSLERYYATDISNELVHDIFARLENNLGKV